MIIAKSTKRGDYYHATLQVIDSDYKKTYYASDPTISRKNALKQAEAWRNESIEYGYVTTA